MQLEWANQIHKNKGGKILIVAPLAVAMQTKREGLKFGIEVNICRHQSDVIDGINITNYEMLQHFNADEFIAVVLDESSILKSYMGKIKQMIISMFKNTPYKLSCTATPAPNDHMELLNQASFLGIMESHEALAIWFINDTANMGKYRLKTYAIKPFWEWVSFWAVNVSKPSDLGYDDGKFKLPKLNENVVEIKVDELDEGFESGCFFREVVTSATGFHKEKRLTSNDRALKCAELCENIDEQVVIWCDTNYEADLLKKYIKNAVEVRGADKPEFKESTAIKFINKEIKVLISKPSIFGFGLNFQNCNNTIFCGLSYSYEDYYQAIRRFWRFGQEKEVNSYIVIGSTEMSVLETVRRKEKQHYQMHKAIYESIKNFQIANLKIKQYKIEEMPNKIKLPKFLRSV
jgi:hypothetical protein